MAYPSKKPTNKKPGFKDREANPKRVRLYICLIVVVSILLILSVTGVF